MGIKHSKKKVLNTNLGFKIIVSLRMVMYVLNRFIGTYLLQLPL